MNFRRLSNAIVTLGRTVLALVFGGAVAGQAQAAAAAGAPSGVLVEFKGAGVSDFLVLPGIAFRVDAGTSPTPFIPAGPFSAVLSAGVKADLRSDFLLQLDLSGAAEVTVNGAVVLSASGQDVSSPPSKPVRFNKGINDLQIRYTSPATGAAYIRLSWGEKPFLLQPIPWGQLSHKDSPEAVASHQVHWGRDTFAELRCARCHTVSGKAMAELSMDAPSLVGIGARRNRDWMQKWILDPKGLRASAHMPRVFTGPDAAEKASAAAAYLSSLKTGGDVALSDPAPWTSLTPPPADGAAEAKPLFESLHCASCHQVPGSAEQDPDKLSLKGVAAKFSPGRLEEFLRKPSAHYEWIRMPNFRLTAAEAGQLAAFLLSKADPAPQAAAAPDAALIAKGREVVTKSGCLNCHAGPDANVFRASELSKITAGALEKGCLASDVGKAGGAPWFGLSAEQRAALSAFAKTDRSSLSREVPLEFALRYTSKLNCASCHGQIEGFPSFETLGSKLQTPWMRAFVAGEIPYKPRAERHPKGEPWLDARMPAFPRYSGPLSEGLGLLSGFSTAPSAEGPVDAARAEVGRTLVGKNGGFSCVSCHAINRAAALEVFESEGLNLAHSAERLRRSFFHRWMRQPMAIDPQTKMPAYFDEDGKSPLAEVFGGDAVKQLDAIWEYLRQGESMAPPSNAAAP